MIDLQERNTLAIARGGTPHPRLEIYRPEIDGLRAIAILLVITFHYFGVLGGYIGVDIFFVISGYLISLQILDALGRDAFSLIDFYAKRVRRILPALAFVICACLLLAWRILFPTDFVLLGKHALAGILNIANFALWQEAGYFDVSSNHKPFLHFWSLGIEEQFYLVWPLLLMGLYRFRQRFALMLTAIIAASFVFNVIATFTDRTFAFYMPVTRFWELGAGGLVALAVVKGRGMAGQGVLSRLPRFHRYAPLLGFGMIVLAVSVLNRQSAFPGFWALLPVIGTCLLIAPAGADTLELKFLRTAPAVFIGKISFSLYLWHWPLLLIAHLSDFDDRASKFVVLAICFVVSWLTYQFVEQPFRKITVTHGNAPAFLGTGAAATVLIAVAGWAIYTGTLRRSWDDSLISRPYVHKQTACGANADFGKPFVPAVFDRCDALATEGAPKIVLLGDSHALNLYEGLQPYLQERGISLYSYPILECTPLSFHDKRPRCVEYNRWIDERIKRLKPDLVLLFAHHLFRGRDPYFGEPIAYADHLWKQAAALRQHGVPNVWIIGGIPNWRESLPHALNFNFLRKGQAVPEFTKTYLVEESLQLDDALRARDNHSGVEYVSLRQALCNESGCLTHVGNTFPEDLLVLDYGHLTRNGAGFVAERILGDRIRALELDRVKIPQ